MKSHRHMSWASSISSRVVVNLLVYAANRQVRCSLRHHPRRARFAFNVPPGTSSPSRLSFSSSILPPPAISLSVASLNFRVAGFISPVGLNSFVGFCVSSRSGRTCGASSVLLRPPAALDRKSAG